MSNDDQAFNNVLNHYRQRIKTEREWADSLPPGEIMHQVDKLLLEVGEDAANLLVDLIVGAGAKTIVELGTSYGFSTLFLASAAQRTGGKVYTYELAEEKQAYARERIGEAGLADQVEWRLGDAVALLADQPGPVDFVFIDLWKDLYVPCFESLYPSLASGAIVVADNMLFPPQTQADAAAYRAAVRAKPDMEAVLLDIGNGLDIASRSKSP
jgi:predicted O-methyltransferase YrrM